MKKKIPNDVLEDIREIREELHLFSERVDEILDQYEIPVDIKEIKSFLAENYHIEPSTSWLQRRYRIGYAEAAKILDQLSKH